MVEEPEKRMTATAFMKLMGFIIAPNVTMRFPLNNPAPSVKKK